MIDNGAPCGFDESAVCRKFSVCGSSSEICQWLSMTSCEFLNTRKLKIDETFTEMCSILAEKPVLKEITISFENDENIDFLIQKFWEFLNRFLETSFTVNFCSLDMKLSRNAFRTVFHDTVSKINYYEPVQFFSNPIDFERFQAFKIARMHLKNYCP